MTWISPFRSTSSLCCRWNCFFLKFQVPLFINTIQERDVLLKQVIQGVPLPAVSDEVVFLFEIVPAVCAGFSSCRRSTTVAQNREQSSEFVARFSKTVGVDVLVGRLFMTVWPSVSTFSSVCSLMCVFVRPKQASLAFTTSDSFRVVTITLFLRKWRKRSEFFREVSWSETQLCSVSCGSGDVDVF